MVYYKQENSYREGFELKKLLAVVISLSMLIALFAGLSVTVEAFDEKYDYVTFTALGDDPYAVFKFGGKGQYQEIDPDIIGWASIRYRTITEYDTAGVHFKGQLYIMPFVEPYIPIEYNFTGEWETVIVDLTMVSDDTYLTSKWDPAYYTSLDCIRFDPLESDRDPESAGDEDMPKVPEGAKIDIAWVCFFEKEEDARAYTGTETVPYCVLGPGALSKPKSPSNNIKAERTKIETPEPVETATPDASAVTETPEPTEENGSTAAPTEQATAVATAEATEIPTDALGTDPTPTPEICEPALDTPEPQANEPTGAPDAGKTAEPAGNDKKDGNGCGGAVSGVCALFALAATAAVIKKKH